MILYSFHMAIYLYKILEMSLCMTKPTKWPVHPAKTRIGLGIRPVWSESSLSAWRIIGSLATHKVHSKDWSDWAHAKTDLSLRRAHSYFVGFVMLRLKYESYNPV